MKIKHKLTILCLAVTLSSFPNFVLGQESDKKVNQDPEIVLLIEKGVNYKNNNQLNEAINTFTTALEKSQKLSDKCSEIGRASCRERV